MYKVTHYSGEYRLQARRRVRQEAGTTNFSRRSCVLSCHSKAAELPLSASGKKAFLYVCVRGTWNETSNYAAYYMEIRRIGTKETCFKRGDVRQTGEQVAGSQRGRVRHRQTDGETGSVAGRQRDIVVLRDRQTGGLAVVSISDNNSSNVIIGSLIKINLISATHNTFCLLKRSLPLWHLSRGERREEVRVDGWTGTIAFLRLSCTAGVCFVQHLHKYHFCSEKVFLPRSFSSARLSINDGSFFFVQISEQRIFTLAS